MKRKLFLLLAALLCATAAWAQTTVTTEDQLTSAIQNGANIVLGDNIKGCSIN